MKSQSSPPNIRRRIVYVDHDIQRWLLVALILMEVGLIAISLGVLHFRLDAIIDESLYRIHLADQPPMYYLLLRETLKVLGWTLFWNTVALVIANRIWVRHVNAILEPFRKKIACMTRLDFSNQFSEASLHPLLVHTNRFGLNEKHRLMHLREVIQKLTPDMSITQEENRKQALDTLEQLRTQLPPTPLSGMGGR